MKHLYQSHSAMSDLPPDTITDILSRLPVKSLLRFRSVSKPWCSLIDSPTFIKTHITQSLKSNTYRTLIFNDQYNSLCSADFDSLNSQKVNHPLLVPHYGTEIVGSCNGLLCLSNPDGNSAIWNPVTGKYHMLPVSQVISPTGCDRIVPRILYGFGYDCFNDDYKVVRMFQFYGGTGDSFHSVVDVYSLKSNSWRKIRDNPYYLTHKGEHGILAGGVLHWLVCRKPKSKTKSLILGFDLRSEEYRLVSQPKYSDGPFQLNLRVLGECLCVACNYTKDRVEVWLMKEYGVIESWAKVFCIGRRKMNFESLFPVAYSKSGNEVLMMQDKEKLVWYDLKHRRVKNLNIRGMPGWLGAETFVGSLVPLSRDWAVDDPKKREKQKEMESEKDEKKNQRKNQKKNQKKRDDFLSVGFKLRL